MPDAAALSLFLLATFVLLITPGPAVLYILARLGLMTAVSRSSLKRC